MDDYIPRILDGMITQRLGVNGALVLEGPRACGKTMTGMYHAASSVRVDMQITNQPAVKEVPSTLLEGETPHLIDEWQLLPSLWNLVRREVDDRRKKGQFILTGSAIPMDDKIRHSGAGRFSRLRMRPFTLNESIVSKGSVHLRELLGGISKVSGKSILEFTDTLHLLMKGGWPELLNENTQNSTQWVRDYVQETSRIDLPTFGISGRSRDPEKIFLVMQSLARNVSAALNVRTIVRDTGGDDAHVSRESVNEYMEALRRVMILEELRAWQPHIRSRTSLRVKPKLYFVDPSIAIATLSLTESKLKADLNYVGQLFENIVVRDMLVYAQANNAKLSYYRDDNGLEADIIVEGEDNAWMAMEIKLGQTYIEDAAKNLLKLREKVDTEKMGEPKALVIITSSGYALTRSDGIHVVPIDLLGP